MKFLTSCKASTAALAVSTILLFSSSSVQVDAFNRTPEADPNGNGRRHLVKQNKVNGNTNSNIINKPKNSKGDTTESASTATTAGMRGSSARRLKGSKGSNSSSSYSDSSSEGKGYYSSYSSSYSSSGSKGKGGSKSSKGKGGSKSSKGKGGSKSSKGKGGSKSSSSSSSYDYSSSSSGSSDYGKGYSGKGEYGKGGVGKGYGKGEYGKGDIGKGYYGKGSDYGKGDMGEGYGKGDMGKGDMGKGYGYGKGDVGKGEMGKGYYSGKGKGGTMPGGCSQIAIFFFNEDLRNGDQTNSIGAGFDNVPFYSTETGQQLGFYSDSSTDLQSNDCVGTGSLSFGKQPEYQSQIAISFTCFGQSNTITGGNGQFGCAEGYEEVAYEDDAVFASVINICGDLCPY